MAEIVFNFISSLPLKYINTTKLGDKPPVITQQGFYILVVKRPPIHVALKFANIA